MNFENDDIIHAPTTSSLILEERTIRSCSVFTP